MIQEIKKKNKNTNRYTKAHTHTHTHTYKNTNRYTNYLVMPVFVIDKSFYKEKEQWYPDIIKRGHKGTALIWDLPDVTWTDDTVDHYLQMKGVKFCIDRGNKEGLETVGPSVMCFFIFGSQKCFFFFF